MKLRGRITSNNLLVTYCLVTLILLQLSCSTKALLSRDDDFVTTIVGMESYNDNDNGGATEDDDNNNNDAALVKLISHWNLYTNENATIINGVVGDHLIFFDPGFQSLLFSWFDNNNIYQHEIKWLFIDNDATTLISLLIFVILTAFISFT